MIAFVTCTLLTALHQLITSLESGKREKILDQAAAARRSVHSLERGLQQCMDKMSEEIVEAKLIQLLRQIEEIQRDAKRELERSRNKLIEDLLKTPDKK